TLDAEEVLAAVEPLVNRRLRARGQSDDDGMAGDSWANGAPLLAGWAAASVQGLSALAPRSGRYPVRLGSTATGERTEPVVFDACAARANGYSLHAGLIVPAGQRERLEGVCRYVLRSPLPPLPSR
ncbi:MAG: hypothetical protein ABI051_10390, partial [Vicinamibacterales bacterium]